ncbi:conserved hypothetical protein [Aliarcobacter butzleri JV22]|uniref:hypothetical protein n=1 Tax=Aliarcobacter butzleri TaxID=28197 RepID=UPI0001F11594|nr:hypothetical protein [Aliarcobacter butzleri]EFU70025.1 conserved hypothetical protein [Aliarcobacter butzleri JV22]
MKTTISYKTTNILIEKLKKQENIEVISNKGFLKNYLTIKNMQMCIFIVVLWMKNLLKI